MRLGEPGVAQILFGDRGEAIDLANDGVAEGSGPGLLRPPQPLAQLFGVEADGGERIADLVGDLRRDAADGRETFRADERLALGTQLPFAGGEALRHGVELVGEDR